MACRLSFKASGMTWQVLGRESNHGRLGNSHNRADGCSNPRLMVHILGGPRFLPEYFSKAATNYSLAYTRYATKSQGDVMDMVLGAVALSTTMEVPRI